MRDSIFTCTYSARPCPSNLIRLNTAQPQIKEVRLQFVIFATLTHFEVCFSRILTLRHCATSEKVAVSIPDGVIEIFHWHNPSGRTTALGLTQPLTGMSTRNILVYKVWVRNKITPNLTGLPTFRIKIKPTYSG